jgi:hypothetical protein
MNSLVVETMWEGLAKAAETKDTEALKELVSLLELIEDKQTRRTEDKEDTKDIVKIPYKLHIVERKGKITDPLFTRLVETTLPTMARSIGRQVFTRYTVITSLEQETKETLTKSQCTLIGQMLTQDFEQMEIIERVSKKTYRFTESFIKFVYRERREELLA